MTATMAMFPLASALLPSTTLGLRVFESRYLAMLAEVSADGDPEFGVVLIDRGHEVGGDDTRFDIATVARVVRMGPGDSAVGVVAVGGRRVRVVQWLCDDPYPRAEVEDLPDLTWDEQWRPLLERTRDIVHHARGELGREVETSPGVVEGTADLVGSDPVAACWQLADTAPVGPLDRLAMLRAHTVEDLLTVVGETTRQVMVLQQAFDA